MSQGTAHLVLAGIRIGSATTVGTANIVLPGIVIGPVEEVAQSLLDQLRELLAYYSPPLDLVIETLELVLKLLKLCRLLTGDTPTE